MITKSLMYAVVCLLMSNNVLLDNLSECNWIQNNYLKCNDINTATEPEILQSAYQLCNREFDNKLKIVNSKISILDVTTLPPKDCNLMSISVTNSKVNQILPHAFVMNINITKIDLSFNSINDLLFMNLTFDELETFVVSHNKLEDVDFNMLGKLKKLKELKLDNNNIKEINEFSEHFDLLNELDLSYNKIEHLQSNFLDLFGTLEILKLHGNPISSLEYPRATSLVLKHFSITNVTELSESGFERLAETEMLQIIDGKIEIIESSALMMHGKLKRLYLDNTTVSELQFHGVRNSTLKYVGPSHRFYKKRHATVFNLTGMSVQKISENVFETVDEVNDCLAVTLRKNQISAIVSKSFFNLHLCTLSIESSGIVELEQRSFTELQFSYCGRLDLSKNHIKKLTADVFHNLRDVAAINLANNSIEDIEFGAFNNIQMYCEGELILSNNKITSLSPQIFKNITYLRHLYLNQNLLQTIDGTWFDGLVMLFLLDLNNNLIAEVSKEIFVYTPNLLTLKIAYNRIETLSENLGRYGLKRLDLQNNPLKASDIDKVKVLDTISWQFSELSKGTLTNFENVENLIVTDSCVETVQSMAFSETNALIHLYFINTTIISLDDRAFKDSKITYAGPNVRWHGRYLLLDLSNLSLRDIGVEAFQKLNTDQLAIILNNNNLTKIRSRAFSNINNLISIHILNSGLIELEANSFINLSFELNVHHTTINLRKNRIQILRTNTFRDIEDVRSIDLSANEIETIESMAFFNISTRDLRLILNNNKIKTLSSTGIIGETVRYSSYLDLSNNLVTKLEGNEFRNILKMGTLNLTNNRLESFNSTVLQHVLEIISVSLHGNPMFQSSNTEVHLETSNVHCFLRQDMYYC